MEKTKLPQSGDTSSNYAVSSKNKKIGLGLLLGPFIGLILIFLLYGIVQSIVIQTTGAPSNVNTAVADDAVDVSESLMNIVRVVLGFAGLLCILGIIIGIPMGIIFLKKKELISGSFDARSGKGKLSEIPEEIKGWNWGAAGLTWIWGVWHSVWISLLFFIPILNIIMIFVLGAKGSEWAWRSQKWESVKKFNISQNKWKPWGILFFIINIAAVLLNFTDFVFKTVNS